MLGPRAADAAAGALLRLLLLLLLPGLRAPGLGVVAAAGAGLPESVIWAVNAGGEAHVDVHGIHFRKDPLEGRVGRGESPSAGPWDPGPASRGRRRRDTPLPSPPAPEPLPLDRGTTSPSGRSFSLQVPHPATKGPGQSPGPSPGSKLPRAIEAESWREVIFRSLWSSVPSASRATQAGKVETQSGPCGPAPGGPAGCRPSIPPLRCRGGDAGSILAPALKVGRSRCLFSEESGA